VTPTSAPSGPTPIPGRCGSWCSTPRVRARTRARSTYVQARLNFVAEGLELAAHPAGFAVHAALDGELVSHIEPVD
jgi:hypothetical protein